MEEVDSGYYNSSGEFIEAPKKHAFRIQIPYSLRFAIIWTLFFAIVGITIQSIKSSTFIFGDFFLSNYGDWFKSFGSFSDVTMCPTPADFIYSILGGWYYFFYTGGLLSLIWGILDALIHFEMIFKVSEKKPQLVKEVIKPMIIEKEVIKPVFLEKSTPPNPLVSKKIEEWLEAGLLLLAEGNVNEAELIYEQISREYDRSADMNHQTYKRILEFYYQILDEKKNPGFNKIVDDWEG